MLNKAVLWNLSYGVYVVSSMDKTKPTGCIANSVVQLTHNTIGVCINKENYTNSVVKQNKEFAISILSQDSNPDIISVFGFTSGKDNNKFEKINYDIKNNLPIVKDSCGYITLKLIQEVELETHTLFVAEITGGDIIDSCTPMTYKYYHDVIKGRAPKTAPTYINPDEIEKVETQGLRYRCSICNYIYNGDITQEPDDFVCPVCKQPKTVFKQI